MRRRSVLVTVAGVVTAGCSVPGSGSGTAIDLLVGNDTDRDHTVEAVVGGRMTPVNASPPPGETASPVGRTKITLDRTFSLAAGGERRFAGVETVTDAPRWVGVTVRVRDGPRLRRPVRVGPTAGGTLIAVRIHARDVTAEVTE